MAVAATSHPARVVICIRAIATEVVATMARAVEIVIAAVVAMLVIATPASQATRATARAI